MHASPMHRGSGVRKQCSHWHLARLWYDPCAGNAQGRCGPWVEETAMEGKEPRHWRETLQKVNALDLEDCLWSYPGVCQHNVTNEPSIPTTVQFLNVGPKARIAQCVKRPMKNWYWFPFKIHSSGRGAVELVQWLKSLAVLSQDSGWIFNSHTVLYNDL